MPLDSPTPSKEARDQAGSLKDLKAPSKLEPLLREIILKAMRLDVQEFSEIDGSGFSNNVIGVSTAAGRLVLRTNVAEHFLKYEKEAWCLQQAHQRGIPVPRVLAYGVLDSKAYSIARYIEDSSAIDASMDHLRIWKSLGSHMAKLNGIATIGCGERMYSPGNFKSTWQDVVNAELAIVCRDNYFEESGTFSRAELDRLQQRLERCGQIDAEVGVCHWDIGCGNARIRNGSYEEIVLLDLEFAMAAPVPHYQLACVGKAHGMFSQEMRAFTSGYGLSDTDFGEVLEDVKALVALKTLRSVRWAQDRRPEQVLNYSADARKMIVLLLGEDLSLS